MLEDRLLVWNFKGGNRDALRAIYEKYADGTFPPTLNPAELAKVSMEMAKAGKFHSEQPMDQDELLKHTMKMTRGMMFVMTLAAESNWRYTGENVNFGDADTAVFWYQPAGSQTYRVIYGDLSIKDVEKSDLPQ